MWYKKKLTSILLLYACIVFCFWLIATIIINLTSNTNKLFDLNITTIVIFMIMATSITSKIILAHYFPDDLISFYIAMKIRFFGLLVSFLCFQFYTNFSSVVIVTCCVFLYFITLFYDVVYVEKQIG